MKIKASLSLFVLLLISVANGYAQGGGPGGGQTCSDGTISYDPDGCPLDTWVMVLVVAASVFVSYKLYRQGNIESSAS